MRRRLVLAVLLAVAGLAAGIFVTAWMAAPVVAVHGIDDGALLGTAAADALRLRVQAEPTDALARAVVRLDGDDALDRIRRTEDALVVDLAGLDEGEHTVVVEVGGRLGAPPVRVTRAFVVDRTPPRLDVQPPDGPAIGDEPVMIAGRTDAEARLMVDEEPAEVADDGTFTARVTEPPPGPITLMATDAAGNTATAEIQVAVVPSRVETDRIHALHVSFYGWASASLREPILRLAEEGRITAVQLDLKDESGMVGYDTAVPLAEGIGADAGIYDLDAAVAELHDRGIHVIGRIVAFRDPVLAEAAWERGDRDWVLQTPDGGPYAGYGGFTNFAHPEVQRYNIDLATEAAAAGVDSILYDYVRRPDGPLEQLVIPGLQGTPEQAIVGFLAASDEALAPFGVTHGASVYGIAVTRPTQIAQDIPAMAEHLDYVAPMVYPSHWARGEYGVAHPNAEPYAIVKAAITDFVAAVEGTRARIVPWLQDFSLGVDYGDDKVRAQIRAAADAGAPEWIMWDPKVTYTEAAYDVVDEREISTDDR